MEAADRAAFEACGLEGAIKPMLINPNLMAAVKATLESAGVWGKGCDKTVGNLLLTLAPALADARAHRRDFVAKYVGEGKIVNSGQLTAAIDFFKKKGADADFEVADFEASCGAGIVCTEADCQKRIAELIETHKEALTTQRYLFPIPSLLVEAKTGASAVVPACLEGKPAPAGGAWRWADGGKIKAALDAAVLALLGPKTAEDEARAAEALAAKKAASKSEGGSKKAAAAPAAAAAATPKAAEAAPAPAPANETIFMGRHLDWAINPPELLAAHKAATGGKVRTRFPPEPNGYLHVGHAKSMNLNFEGAFRALGLPEGTGECIFRYDDTNPEKENDVYIRSQADNVAWLGWKPVKTTHSSDYFPQLYDFAVQLIKKGSAYVCHMSKEEMEASREAAWAKDGRDPNSPWRNRPVEESLRCFQAMRDGYYEEGKAVLRLKVDMAHENPTMWDPVAYRIKYSPHPVAGNAWCIYPSYDYSHCIIDSLEHIDYSLCTLEFEVRREIYYWVLNELNIYRPMVWEFSRLNVTNFMMSKRKILKLVEDNKVRGWDDPRLATINGLRRRGYTPEALNAFCRNVGVTRSYNVIQLSKFEYFVREHLDATATRAFAVLDPLKVTLINVAPDAVTWLEVPDFPRDKALGVHTVALSNVVYIEADDFREVDSKDYYGLAPGKTAGLRYGGYIKVVDVVRDATGKAVELRCEYDAERSATAGKVKGNLHWVSSPVPGAEPPCAEVRLYDNLFTTEDPGSTGDWEAEINPHSEVVLPKVYIDASLAGWSAAGPASRPCPSVFAHFQFERLGYFVVDPDSLPAEGKMVFNRTVSLKEDATVRKGLV